MVNELVQDVERNPFVRLEGMTMLGDRFAMVTSTKFVPGENATDTEIADWMHTRGFRRLADDKWFRAADGCALFDVAEPNVIHSDEGVIVPVDVIPIRPKGRFLKRIRDALAASGGR